jgi:hypothetical protein
MVKRPSDVEDSGSRHKRLMRELRTAWAESPSTAWKEMSSAWIAPEKDALREALEEERSKIFWRWEKADKQMNVTIVWLVWKVEKSPLRDFEHNFAVTPSLRYCKADGLLYGERGPENIRRFWNLIPPFPRHMFFDTKRLGELYCDKWVPHWLNQAIQSLADEYAFAFHAERMASNLKRVSSFPIVDA